MRRKVKWVLGDRDVLVHGAAGSWYRARDGSLGASVDILDVTTTDGVSVPTEEWAHLIPEMKEKVARECVLLRYGFKLGD